jgi:SAM-dependent methyltransferase
MPAAVMNAPDRLQGLRNRWDRAGKTDPFWAVLSQPDKRGNRWESDEFFETGVQEIADVMQHVTSLGIVHGHERALDFGCGPGRLTQALARYFGAVDGVDISPSMIQLARDLNKFPERCGYHQNSASDLRLFDDATFDMVYSSITLQHVDPVYARDYIREFVRVLRPGALVIFQLPGRRTGRRSAARRYIPAPVFRLYLRVRYRDHPAATMNGMPREEVVALVDSLGAEVLDVEPNNAAGAGWESFLYYCRRAK